MGANHPRRMAANLDIIPFTHSPEAPAGLACTLCREHLELNQPNLQAPNHLIGVCEGCQRWHLIQLEPDGNEAIMVVLPEWGLFKAAAEARDAPPGHAATSIKPSPAKPGP